MIDRAKAREYQNRQNYRRFPLDKDHWRKLGRQAKDRDVTRTALGAAYLRSAIDTNGEGVTLTPRESWPHAQKHTDEDGDLVLKQKAGERDLEELMRAERERQWLVGGANLLSGDDVKRVDLKR